MPPRRAAGIVPVRLAADGWRVLILRVYRNWDFPKGEIDLGEDGMTAAIREAQEEAAITDLRFPWGREGCATAPYSRGKVATYFLGQTDKVEVELPISPELGRPEHHEGRWVDFDGAAALLPDRLQPILAWARARVDS